MTAFVPDVASAPGRRSASRRVGDSIAVSHGAPNRGRLVDGVQLQGSERIRIVPAYAGVDSRWGVAELVAMLERAAEVVHQRHPTSVLSVGDISSRSGGQLREHLSHQSGRDVDIGFYMLDQRGRPVYLPRFWEVQADGTCAANRAVRFDDARNWTLIEALLTDKGASVQRIFVSNDVRARLLREAERRQVPLAIRLRAARVMMQPRGTTPHADHFHVRIGCPPDQHDVCKPRPEPRGRRRSGDTSRPRRTSQLERQRHGTYALL